MEFVTLLENELMGYIQYFQIAGSLIIRFAPTANGPIQVVLGFISNFFDSIFKFLDFGGDDMVLIGLWLIILMAFFFVFLKKSKADRKLLNSILPCVLLIVVFFVTFSESPGSNFALYSSIVFLIVFAANLAFIIYTLLKPFTAEFTDELIFKIDFRVYIIIGVSVLVIIILYVLSFVLKESVYTILAFLLGISAISVASFLLSREKTDGYLIVICLFFKIVCTPMSNYAFDYLDKVIVNDVFYVTTVIPIIIFQFIGSGLWDLCVTVTFGRYVRDYLRTDYSWNTICECSQHYAAHSFTGYKEKYMFWEFIDMLESALIPDIVALGNRFNYNYLWLSPGISFILFLLHLIIRPDRKIFDNIKRCSMFLLKAILGIVSVVQAKSRILTSGTEIVLLVMIIILPIIIIAVIFIITKFFCKKDDGNNPESDDASISSKEEKNLKQEITEKEKCFFKYISLQSYRFFLFLSVVSMFISLSPFRKYAQVYDYNIWDSLVSEFN